MPLAAGLAVREAAGEEIRLKWPNDLVVDGRKVGGILAETGDDTAVVGLGLNVWWPEPIPGAAALLSTDPGPDAPQWIAEQWADGLLARVSGPAERWGLGEYLEVCDTLGREIVWEPAGRGTATGVAADGGLIVETEEGPVTLHAGEVREVRG